MSKTRPVLGRLVVRSAAFLDGAIDGIVVAFAVWTLVYQACLALQVTMWPLGWVWSLVGVATVVASGVRSVRHREGGAPAGDSRSPGSAPLAASTSLRVAWGVLVALFVLCVVMRQSWGITPLAVVAAAAVVLQLGRWWRSARVPLEGPEPERDAELAPVAPWEHGLAALASLALGVLSVFLLKPDADDAFYVNRATWVAERGTAALKDTMFSPDRLPSAYGGGLPTPSVEALQGVLAHMLGVTAPTFVYLMFGPLLSVLLGWVTWRLVRAWAPRRAGVAFVVAILFLLASGLSIVGNYSIGRIWQGKAAAYAILLPLIWLYLTRLADRPRRRELWLLLAAGTAFVGLTTTSALQTPVIGGAAILAALVLRSRALAAGAGMFVLAPLVNAAVQLLGPSQVDTPDSLAATPASMLLIAFGSSVVLVLIGVGAVVFGPAVVRGRGRVVVACGSLATVACLFPGLLKLAASLTGAGPVVWRLGIAMPVWVLVGVLASAPVEDLVRKWRFSALAGWAAPVLASIAVFASATWLWAPEAGAQLTSRPTWKVPQSALADVRAVQQLPVGRGRWLLPPTQMEVVSISKAGPYPVVPRHAYLPNLEEPHRYQRAREVLIALVLGVQLSPESVVHSMDVLDVAVACVPGDEPRARRILRAAAGEGLQRVGTMRCHVRTPA